MKIAFFGSSLLSAYWNGAATYYRGMIRNLHALGHQITFYEPDAYGRQQNRDIDPPDWARVCVYRREVTPAFPERSTNAVANADCIVKASGVGVFDEWLEREIPQAARSGLLTIFWDVDAPATLDRLASNADDAFHSSLPKYDLVLTYGGGDPVVTAYGRAGARGMYSRIQRPGSGNTSPCAGKSWFLGELVISWETACRIVKNESRSSFFARRQSYPIVSSCSEATDGMISHCRPTFGISVMLERRS